MGRKKSKKDPKKVELDLKQIKKIKQGRIQGQKIDPGKLDPKLRKELEDLERELSAKEQIRQKDWKDMRILWFSVAPYIKSGYGIVTKQFVSRLIQRGFTSMVAAYYGLAKGGFLKVGLRNLRND